MAALANLLLLEAEGLRTLLGHIVENAEVLREALEAHPDLTVLNARTLGPSDVVPRLSARRGHVHDQRARAERRQLSPQLAI